jgi:hypothetical protein
LTKPFVRLAPSDGGFEINTQADDRRRDGHAFAASR